MKKLFDEAGLERLYYDLLCDERSRKEEVVNKKMAMFCCFYFL